MSLVGAERKMNVTTRKPAPKEPHTVFSKRLTLKVIHQHRTCGFRIGEPCREDVTVPRAMLERNAPLPSGFARSRPRVRRQRTGIGGRDRPCGIAR